MTSEFRFGLLQLRTPMRTYYGPVILEPWAHCHSGSVPAYQDLKKDAASCALPT